MLAPHMLFNSYSSLVPVQPVSGVINKDWTEAETLTCRAVNVQELVSFPHVTNPHPALHPVTHLCQIG